MSEWQCKFCGISCNLPEEQVQRSGTTLLTENALGPQIFFLNITVCPNTSCRQLHAELIMYSLVKDQFGTLGPAEHPSQRWPLIPAADAKPVPPYVPEHIAIEYQQACQVKQFAPNAAATLARRCLQSMVRDFWGVKRHFLAEELDAIEDRIDPETLDTILAVRHQGHIGKHMEKGVNLIIDTDAEEVDVLLGLIEFLLEDWYVARHQRQERLQKIKGLKDLPTVTPAQRSHMSSGRHSRVSPDEESERPPLAHPESEIPELVPEPDDEDTASLFGAALERAAKPLPDTSPPPKGPPSPPPRDKPRGGRQSSEPPPVPGADKSPAVPKPPPLPGGITRRK
jgi:hypothetical protein